MFTALTLETARIGQEVCPSDARTLLPAKHERFTIKRCFTNARGQACAVLCYRGETHERACVTVDSLWLITR